MQVMLINGNVLEVREIDERCIADAEEILKLDKSEINYHEIAELSDTVSIMRIDAEVALIGTKIDGEFIKVQLHDASQCWGIGWEE